MENITVPVLRYKSNGQDLCKTKKTINTINGVNNAYYYYDNENSNYINIVLRLSNDNKEIYFVEGNYNANSLEKINQDLINNAILNYYKNLNDIENVRFVSKMVIQIAFELGLNFKKLEELRQEFQIEKLKKDNILKELKEKEKIENEKKEFENVVQKFKDFSNGLTSIDYDTLEVLIKENNIEKPHIRTIGSLRKREVKFTNKGNSYIFKGKTKYCIFRNDPVFLAIEKLKEIYN